ncbi:MAG: hypothetical protein F6J90_32890 [Moorea sp. SIOASIH]|nr:hypothetical protein [Moorena sp. SIOASIH]
MPVPRLMPILPRSPNGQDAHSTKIAERARCPFHLTIKIIPLLSNAPATTTLPPRVNET